MTSTTQGASPARAGALSVTDTLMERICQCPSLPSLPAVAVQVLRATSRDDAEVTSVAEQVAQDAALVARLLRAVNSSYYGLRHRITPPPEPKEPAMIQCGMNDPGEVCC